MNKKRIQQTNYYWPMFIYINSEDGEAHQAFTQRACMTLKKAKEWIKEKTLINSKFGGKVITSYIDVYGYDEYGIYKKRRRVCVKTNYVSKLWF